MRALVTGGGGFLGGALARELVKRGHEVRSLSRGHYPRLEELGVRHRRADLADRTALLAEAQGCDVVFHVAALAGVWGPRADYVRANVQGTRHVLAACLEAGVPRLVHTSSPSVCFDGEDHVNASNDLPYPRRFLAAYPETKAIAEREVLAANGPDVATCALRPHLIFGPGDPHLLPRIVQRARDGQLAIVGRGDNEVTLCYVENAVHAHLLAAERLAQPEAACSGRAYFIGQEHPVQLWPWIDDLLARLGLPPVKRRVPAAVAHAAGAAMELAWRATRRREEPRMTRFVAAQLATSHSYDMEPARRDLGYREVVGMDEALDRTVADLRSRGLAGA